jgi:type I restriction enzyme S subunit
VFRSNNIRGGRLDLSDRSYTTDEEFVARNRRATPETGDLIITREAPMGEVAMIPEGILGCLGQRMVLLRPDSTLMDPRFMLYAIMSPSVQHEISTHDGTGSTVSNLRIPALKALKLPSPPLHDQRAIAGVLGALDDKIELNRRMNETLELMARAQFKSWFVDFDPVRAKIAGRDPAHIEPATARLFPSKIDCLTQAPIGWIRKPLGKWVEATSGGTPAKSNTAFWGGDIPWISPKVMTEIYADEADEHVTLAAIGNGTRLAPAGATLVMVRGMGLHREVRVSQTRREVTFNQDVKALVPHGIQSILLLFALLDGQQELLGKVESSGHGTGVLPSATLFGHSIAMPPDPVQVELAKSFDLIGDRIALARDEMRTLVALRDLLLPRLLSGELRIRDVKAVA